MDADLVGNKSSGNMKRKNNRRSWKFDTFGSLFSLAGAVVDEVLDPVRMLAGDGAPEKALVCAPF